MTRSVSDLQGRAEPAGKRLHTKADPPCGKPTHPLGLTVERRAKRPNQSPQY